MEESTLEAHEGETCFAQPIGCDGYMTTRHN